MRRFSDAGSDRHSCPVFCLRRGRLLVLLPIDVGACMESGESGDADRCRGSLINNRDVLLELISRV